MRRYSNRLLCRNFSFCLIGIKTGFRKSQPDCQNPLIAYLNIKLVGSRLPEVSENRTMEWDFAEQMWLVFYNELTRHLLIC